MQKSPQPESPAPERERFFGKRHGVFYPTNHYVVVYEDEAQALAAQRSLAGLGASPPASLLVGPSEMAACMRESERDATIVAQIVSAELKQVSILAQLAGTDHFFLIIDGADLERDVFVDRVLRDPPVKTMFFALLAIEEVTAPRKDQAGESPYGINEGARAPVRSPTQDR